MICDSNSSRVMRTKAPLPLCEVYFTSEEAREALNVRFAVAEVHGNEVHPLSTAIYFKAKADEGVQTNQSVHGDQVA